MSIARTLRNDRETMGEHPMYRPSRGHGQPQSHQAVGSSRLRRSEDPLAELARLIGQEDPFKEFDAIQPRRVPANGHANGIGGNHAAPAAPQRRIGGGNGAGTIGAAQTQPRITSREIANEAPRPSSRMRSPQAEPLPTRAPLVREERHYEPRPTRAPIPQPQSRGNGAARVHEEQPRTVRAREAYPEENSRPSRQPAAAPEQRARRSEPQRTDRYVPEEAPRHARSRPQPVHQDQYQRGYERDYDPEYDDEAYLPEHADDIYDEVQRPGRGWGFWLVVAVVVASLIAIAILGLFAYRTVFNAPPRAAVVTKSAAPVKVEPKNNPAQTAVSPSNKPIQDRVGGVDTQVLPREESPVDLTKQNPQQVAPPVQRPAPQQQKNNPAFTAPAPQQPQQALPQPEHQQPKRVKTITVRPDGSLVQPNAPQQQNNNPVQLQPNAQEPETQVAPPQNPNRPNTNVPAPNRTASLGPTPAPVAAPAPTSGNYVVQVASHKTPEEAKGAWDQLRSQYAQIFGARNADIRKVDLGDRGTFYRAMVGPMNREQANALCQNLKTQGAGCIVQTR
jgi:hypothetical protein